MYTILYDGDTVHDPRSHDRYITDGTLSLEINTAGELSFTIPPTHPLFGRFEALNPRHELTVEEDGQEIFRGRILDHNRDIYTATSIKAEGQLAYLNDSVVRPYGTYPDTPDEGQEPQWTTIAPNNRADYALWLVEQHNANTDGTKRFKVQGLDLDASPITRSSTQFPNTANEILDKVLTPFGLILSAGYDGERTLEFRREHGCSTRRSRSVPTSPRWNRTRITPNSSRASSRTFRRVHATWNPRIGARSRMAR